MLKCFLLTFSLMLFSCSKKLAGEDVNYTEEEFQNKTLHLTSVNPVGENVIPYSEYSPKVNKLISKTFKYERLRFYAIGFNSVEDAKAEAKRLNQYYSRNYVFDQVEGEPLLEDMVITHFNAKNPNREVQRVPKAHSEEHGSHASHDEKEAKAQNAHH